MTNASDDDLPVDITGVTVHVEPKGDDGRFGRNGDPDETLVTLTGTTGGSNPLTPSDFIPGPEGTTTCYTLEVNDPGIQNISRGADFKVHLIVEFAFHRVHGIRTRTEVDVVEC